jgi:hypothetical protein
MQKKIIMIKNLENDPNYCDLFYKNINKIVAHTKDDFTKQINVLDIKKVCELRSFLSIKLLKIINIDNYDLKLINRRGSDKKKSCIDDLYILTHYIVDECFGIEFDKLYNLSVKPSAILKPDLVNNKIVIKSIIENMGDNAALQQILTSIQALQDKVGSIEGKVDGVILDNKAIKAEISNMKDDIVKINDTLANESNTNNKENTMQVDDHVKGNEHHINFKKRKQMDDGYNHKLFEDIPSNYSQSGYNVKQHLQYNPIERKKHIVHGISKDNTIKVAPNKFCVYLGRVDCNEEKVKISQFLDKLNLKHSDLTLIESNNPNRKFNSFRFNIPYEQKNIIYIPENWPTGTVVKKYTMYNNRKNQGHHSNDPIHISTPYIDCNKTKSAQNVLKAPTLVIDHFMQKINS